jgi:transcription elongation factor Elf1
MIDGLGDQLQYLSMNCPGCGTEMTPMSLDGRLGKQITIDVCAACQAFWFDHFESLQLSAGSTLKLMKFIGEHSSPGKPSLPNALRCPRCAAALHLAHNIQRNMPFTYWCCANDDGHFISFFEFLKEKNFIHTLSPEQIKELRQNVQFVNCSSCGASINLESNSVCPYCHSPISMLDMKQPQVMLEQLKQAAEPKPVDPALPMKLAFAKLDLETSLADHDQSPEWWSDARSSGLVQAGLNAVTRWLSDKLVD